MIFLHLFPKINSNLSSQIMLTWFDSAQVSCPSWGFGGRWAFWHVKIKNPGVSYFWVMSKKCSISTDKGSRPSVDFFEGWHCQSIKIQPQFFFSRLPQILSLFPAEISMHNYKMEHYLSWIVQLYSLGCLNSWVKQS